MGAVRRRFVLSIVAVLASGLVLAGCAAQAPALGASTPSPSGPVEPACAAPGAASDAISVRGELGEEPIIIADGPFTVDRVERTVLVEGEGPPAAAGDLVAVTFTMLNATSGDESPGTAAVRVLLDATAALPGLVDTILCSTAGSRVVGVVPAEAAFGSAGQPDLGIGPDDDVIFVIDVLALIPLQAAGEVVAIPTDFPALGIEFDETGRPSVEIPQSDPPATTRATTLLEGDGAVVAAGDEFLVQFQALNWRTGAVFDETWGDAPRSLLSILPGVDAAIVGRSVGSRFVVIVAPADGYGSAGAPSSGIAPADTVVYVVDILATTPPPA
jgi:FKBP-type peptidyl-prolyl cis-trans isomerase